MLRLALSALNVDLRTEPGFDKLTRAEQDMAIKWMQQNPALWQGLTNLRNDQTPRQTNHRIKSDAQSAAKLELVK